MLQKIHRESRVVAVSVERMFDLVADVERYPEFLPLMRGAKIVRRHERAYETEQVLALGRLGWSLRRIESETGVRRETASAYLKAAGIEVRRPGWRRHTSPARRSSAGLYVSCLAR